MRRSTVKKREGSGAFDTSPSSIPTEVSSSSLASTKNKDGNGTTSGMSSSNRSVVLPLSMQLMQPFWGMGCQCCASTNNNNTGAASGNSSNNPSGHNNINSNDSSSEDVRTDYEMMSMLQRSNSVVSPLVVAPMIQSSPDASSVEQVIGQYIAACRFYGVADRVNAGVLTTLRFRLPALRVSGSFHDADMLALAEVLFRHANGALSYIKRLDFSIASKEGKYPQGKFFGFRSHGAFTLSKVLQSSRNIEEVFLQRNRVGPYGASAIFLAAAENKTLRVLVMRRCLVSERGGMAFAEHVCRSKICGLREVDLSANQIGFHGSKEIERELAKRETNSGEGQPYIMVNMEGNLVFQEVMNSVTHGLGILLALVGTILLSYRVRDKPLRHVISCGIYSASLVVLYTSSTLYHSFFSLQATKYIFEVCDKCAIYILIGGSYTPMLQIVVGHRTIWSVWLQSFIWICCIGGIFVEFFLPVWKHKLKFSLAMYLGTGWATVVCLPEIMELVPRSAINLLVLGGVSYTVGVPFFVRNNNLDHSIWHLFVLAASMFHWFGIYYYMADWDYAAGVVASK